MPTVGGPLCCDPAHLPAGPRDQKDVESRQDVLIYSTDPLDQDLEVTGPVSLDLFASSSAVDTDFTAKLVDVWPNGYAQNLTEGILRARYRESTTRAKPIEPGKIYEYKIDLWSTSNVFLKGHRIRLEVSSSNFPRFDRNLNTGKPAATDSAFVKATKTIYHDTAHPSALILPVGAALISNVVGSVQQRWRADRSRFWDAGKLRTANQELRTFNQFLRRLPPGPYAVRNPNPVVRISGKLQPRQLGNASGNALDSLLVPHRVLSHRAPPPRNLRCLRLNLNSGNSRAQNLAQFAPHRRHQHCVTLVE